MESGLGRASILRRLTGGTASPRPRPGLAYIHSARSAVLAMMALGRIAGLLVLRQACGPVSSAVHDMEREVVEAGKPVRRESGPLATRLEHGVSLREGEPFSAGSLEFDVLHTPGHSPGGVSLKIDGFLFAGDALFAGSIGRSDFANSDGRALIDGIREKLLPLPDDLIVYSGHGPATTIGRERRMNPFLT